MVLVKLKWVKTQEEANVGKRCIGTMVDGSSKMAGSSKMEMREGEADGHLNVLPMHVVVRQI